MSVTKTVKTRTLYRPMGVGEMVKILEADAARFPPRLPEQPIFYPVLNRQYAEQIAERWNAPNPGNGFAGFVTEFQVNAKYASRFKSHLVGSSLHRELWVPADELEAFNRQLVGPIRLAGAYYGEGYVGPDPRPAMLQRRTAREQLPLLAGILAYSAFDFMLVIRVQRVVVQLNFAYWVRTDFTADGFSLEQKVEVLRNVLAVWHDAFPATALLGSEELAALEDTVTN
jgi:hypothetical protein